MGSERFSSLAKCNSLDAVTEEPELEECGVQRPREDTPSDDAVQMRPKEHNPPIDMQCFEDNQPANGKPHFTKNNASKYGIAGVLGGGALNGGEQTDNDKPPKPLRSYSKIAQIFEEFSVSKVKVKY